MLPSADVIEAARRVLRAIAQNSYPAKPDILRLRQWAGPRGMRPIKEIAFEVMTAAKSAANRK